MSARFVRIPLAETLTGYTQKAIRRKIEDGVWLEGKHYVRAPDGAVLIDLKGYEDWATGNQNKGDSGG